MTRCSRTPGSEESIVPQEVQRLLCLSVFGSHTPPISNYGITLHNRIAKRRTRTAGHWPATSRRRDRSPGAAARTAAVRARHSSLDRGHGFTVTCWGVALSSHCNHASAVHSMQRQAAHAACDGWPCTRRTQTEGTSRALSASSCSTRPNSVPARMRRQSREGSRSPVGRGEGAVVSS